MAIAVLLAACSTGNVRESSSRVEAQASTRAGASTPPPYGFRLAAEGLPVEGRWKSVPATADVNNDGKPDIIVHPRLAKGARVFLGDGNGAWRESSQGLAMASSCGGAVRSGDVNRDGMADIVVADHCEGVFVYLGDGKGNWRAAAEGLNPRFNSSPRAMEYFPSGYRGAEVLALGDVNGDGLADIVASSTDQGGFTVYLGDGTGVNWREVDRPGLPNGEESEPSDVYFGGFAFDIHLVDVNADGHLDVVASYYTGPRAWTGDGTGRFVSRSKGLLETTVGGIYRRMALGDVNRDGRPDIVVANSINGVELYLQNADGTWQGPLDAMPDLHGGALAVAIGDIDGDGHVDLVVAGALVPFVESDRTTLPNGLFVLWGDSRGEFSRRRSTSLPGRGLEVIWGIQLRDVNGDGRLDIVVTAGGEAGRVPESVTRAAAMAGRPVPAQTAMSLPRVQVWLNEAGAGQK